MLRRRIAALHTGHCTAACCSVVQTLAGTHSLSAWCHATGRDGLALPAWCTGGATMDMPMLDALVTVHEQALAAPGRLWLCCWQSLPCW